jgi:hypothetical protein
MSLSDQHQRTVTCRGRATTLKDQPLDPVDEIGPRFDDVLLESPRLQLGLEHLSLTQQRQGVAGRQAARFLDAHAQSMLGVGEVVHQPAAPFDGTHAILERIVGKHQVDNLQRPLDIVDLRRGPAKIRLSECEVAELECRSTGSGKGFGVLRC